MNKILYLFICLFCLGCTISKSKVNPSISKGKNDNLLLHRTFLFVGSYTNQIETEGIYVYELNSKTGELILTEKEDNLTNPSYLITSTDGKHLFACVNTKSDNDGSVAAFKIDSSTGYLTFINKQSTKGRNPVHLEIDPTNSYLLASNYTDAGICVFKINNNGSIQPSSQLIEFEGKSLIQGRQDAAHIHSCNFSPDGTYVIAPDLGADKIRVFTFDSTLTERKNLTIRVKQGAGPRHFIFHPTQSFAYCIEELSGTVSLYNYKNGQLHFSNKYESYERKQSEYASSDLHISPDGEYLYVSNRQNENSISIFKINQQNGQLSLKRYQSTFGEIPRSFVIDPTGAFLIVANQATDEIVVFERNPKTGLLTKLNSQKGLKSPSSLKIVQY